jgi:hypothetical protein
VISAPRRSVTRFFIPLIDVLILLFCIFLLMPFVSVPAKPEEEAKPPAPPPELPSDVKELQRQLAEAKARLDRQEKARAKLADRLSVRVLEIDPRDGTLYYFDPDRQEVRSEEDALRLINKQKWLAGQKDVFFLILYPRELSGFPTEPQIHKYRQWFKDVPYGFDNPRSRA